MICVANKLPKEIEIAKYPIRCHICGKTEVVHVFVYRRELNEALINGFSSHECDMPTHRLAPIGWRWTVNIDNNFMPIWLCPDCGPCVQDKKE